MRIPFFLLLAILSILLFAVRAGAGDEYAAARDGLIELIEGYVRETRQYIDEERLDPKVMAALRAVPRHEFVPPSLREHAYENRPLAIGYGQTISQPYIVALMTDLLEIQPTDRVLEIGTGSGYQAAVLAQLAREVYTIEIIEPLATQAEARFARLTIDNVETRSGDGYYGWPEHAPFDAIVVTAAASHVPPPLIGQLNAGGRMVIPVGGRFQTQQLLLVTKKNDGSVTVRQILPVAFVPLTGGH